jgi:hypothetical protein
MPMARNRLLAGTAAPGLPSHGRTPLRATAADGGYSGALPRPIPEGGTQQMFINRSAALRQLVNFPEQEKRRKGRRPAGQAGHMTGRQDT